MKGMPGMKGDKGWPGLPGLQGLPGKDVSTPSTNNILYCTVSVVTYRTYGCYCKKSIPQADLTVIVRGAISKSRGATHRTN